MVRSPGCPGLVLHCDVTRLESGKLNLTLIIELSMLQSHYNEEGPLSHLDGSRIVFAYEPVNDSCSYYLRLPQSKGKHPDFLMLCL